MIFSIKRPTFRLDLNAHLSEGAVDQGYLWVFKVESSDRRLTNGPQNRIDRVEFCLSIKGNGGHGIGIKKGSPKVGLPRVMIRRW